MNVKLLIDGKEKGSYSFSPAISEQEKPERNLVKKLTGIDIPRYSKINL
jgi:hypothetical protein